MFEEWGELQRLLVALFGILLLTSGTRFYKFVVILPGVATGSYLGVILSLGQVDEVRLLAIGTCGVLGMVLSLLVEKLAIAIFGALFGGAIAQLALPIFLGTVAPWYWPVIGAVFGGMIIPPLFSRFVPLLSSLAGAFCVAWSMELANNYPLIVGLTVLGFFVQRLFGAKKPDLEE